MLIFVGILCYPVPVSNDQLIAFAEFVQVLAGHCWDNDFVEFGKHYKDLSFEFFHTSVVLMNILAKLKDK